MKKKLVMTLMLTCALSSGFASTGDISTLAKRADLVKEAGSDVRKLIENVNKKQQEGDIKVDDKNYIVVIEKRKEGDTNVFTRVAHSKKEKVGQKVDESVLLDVLRNAEDALKSGDGPVRVQFNVDGKPLYALVSRSGDFLIFNICADEKEVNNLLTGNQPEEKKPDEKKQEEKKPESVEVKPEEKKPEEKKTENVEVKLEEKKVKPKLDGDDKSKEDTTVGKNEDAIEAKEDKTQTKKSEEANSNPVKESAQN
ncbi:MAG: hypothetical protein WCN27_00265 [Alphaproteobacteria bacterium]